MIFHRHRWKFIGFGEESKTGIYQRNPGETTTCISKPSIYKCEKCGEEVHFCELPMLRTPLPLFGRNKK